VEASWYGEQAPTVPLGADFHARRLRIIASQVGEVAAGQRLRRTRQQRMQAALAALDDDRFDDLITGASSWRKLPSVLQDLTTASQLAATTLCHVLDYDEIEKGP